MKSDVAVRLRGLTAQWPSGRLVGCGFKDWDPISPCLALDIPGWTMILNPNCLCLVLTSILSSLDEVLHSVGAVVTATLIYRELIQLPWFRFVSSCNSDILIATSLYWCNKNKLITSARQQIKRCVIKREAQERDSARYAAHIPRGDVLSCF